MNKIEISSKQKYFIIIKLMVFNVFFIGFVLNFIPFSNSNWVKSEHYTFGVLQYCKLLGTNESNTYIFHLEDFRLTHESRETVKCYTWTPENRPSLKSFIYIL